MDMCSIGCLCLLVTISESAKDASKGVVQHADVLVTSEDDLFGTLCSTPEIATTEDWRRSYKQWAEQLEPIVSPLDLAILIESKRESIGALHSRMEVTTRRKGARPWSVISEFARRDDSLLHRSEIIDRGDTELESDTIATDGEFERTIDNDATQSFGNIRYAEKGRRSYYHPFDPLPLQMLTDSERDLGFLWYAYDLVGLLRRKNSLVLEDEIEVDGARCIVVTLGQPATFRAFLDIERDFAVIRFQEFRYETANEIPVRRWVSTDRVSRDFQEYGNGLWLPREVSCHWYDGNGELGDMREHRLLDVSVGEAVDPQMFTELFTEGTFIRDSTRRIGYYYGRDESVQEALDTAISASESVMTRNQATLAEEDESGSTWRIAADLRMSGVVVGGLFLVYLWRRRVFRS